MLVYPPKGLVTVRGRDLSPINLGKRFDVSTAGGIRIRGWIVEVSPTEMQVKIGMLSNRERLVLWFRATWARSAGWRARIVSTLTRPLRGRRKES